MLYRMLAILALVTLVGAGCGSGEPASQGNGGEEETTEEASQEVPTLEGEELPAYEAPGQGLVEAIRERGRLINGVEAQNPPWEFVDDDGEIVGYDIDLSRGFAEYLGVELEIVDTAWSGVIPSLYSNKFDMIWSAMTITEPRQEAVNFSLPYGSDGVEFIVQAGDDRVQSIEDLNGMVVGTQLNSAAEFQLEQLVEDHDLDIEIRSYDHFDGAYLDLANGNIDVATSTQLNNLALFENNPGVYEVALELPIFNLVGVATRKPDTDLLEEINAYLRQIEESGELAELQDKWFNLVMDLPW